MPPQVVGPKMDPHQGAGFFDHNPSSGIGDGEYPLIPWGASGFDIIFQPVGQLLGDEYYLSAFSAFGVPDGQLLVIHIQGGKLQDLAHPHATSGHKLQHEAVSHLWGPEDDLVNNILFMNLPLSQLSWSEKLLQHGVITKILELSI